MQEILPISDNRTNIIHEVNAASLCSACVNSNPVHLFLGNRPEYSSTTITTISIHKERLNHALFSKFALIDLQPTETEAPKISRYIIVAWYTQTEIILGGHYAPPPQTPALSARKWQMSFEYLSRHSFQTTYIKEVNRILKLRFQMINHTETSPSVFPIPVNLFAHSQKIFQKTSPKPLFLSLNYLNRNLKVILHDESIYWFFSPI